VAKRKTARTRPPAAQRAVKRQARRPGPPVASRRPAVDVQEIESLRTEIARVAKGAGVPRWNADPEDVRRSVMKLVLQLLERQAIRRLDAGSLSAKETEAVGLALMRLEETVRDLALQFGLDPAELNLDLGPVGKLI
jgi:hypothetical protein